MGKVSISPESTARRGSVVFRLGVEDPDSTARFGGTGTRGDEELVPSVVVVVEEEENRRVGRGESGCESRVHRLRRQLVFDGIRRGRLRGDGSFFGGDGSFSG
jgi:hypothetical protein